VFSIFVPGLVLSVQLDEGIFTYGSKGFHPLSNGVWIADTVACTLELSGQTFEPFIAHVLQDSVFINYTVSRYTHSFTMLLVEICIVFQFMSF